MTPNIDSYFKEYIIVQDKNIEISVEANNEELRVPVDSDFVEEVVMNDVAAAWSMCKLVISP